MAETYGPLNGSIWIKIYIIFFQELTRGRGARADVVGSLEDTWQLREEKSVWHVWCMRYRMWPHEVMHYTHQKLADTWNTMDNVWLTNISFWGHMEAWMAKIFLNLDSEASDLSSGMATAAIKALWQQNWWRHVGVPIATNLPHIYRFVPCKNESSINFVIWGFDKGMEEFLSRWPLGGA